MMKQTEQAKKIIDEAEEAAWTIEELKNFIFVSVISADNDEYSEEVKQEVLQRYNKCKSEDSLNMNWKYIFEPTGEDSYKYVKLFEAE